MGEKFISGTILKQTALTLGVVILALLVVGGLLFFKTLFFPPTVSDHADTHAATPAPITPEQEAYLIESTTAPAKTNVSAKERQALINSTSASSVPQPSK